MNIRPEKITVERDTGAFAGGYRTKEGYHFFLEAPESAETAILLYYRHDKVPTHRIPLTDEFRTGRARTVLLKGLDERNYEYNFEIDGKVCTDPYAAEIAGREIFGAQLPDDPHHLRCALLHKDHFNWGEYAYRDIPPEDLVLYKLSVRGYTMGEQSGVRKRGTFAGLAEKIPYFQELGINALELMPAYEFPEIAARKEGGMIQMRLNEKQVNLWGYVAGNYFAPKRSFCSGSSPQREMKEMVRSMHKAGIAVYLEFYFPAGVNAILALKALQFWRTEYHIDGFHVHGEGAPIEWILADPLLSDARIFVPGSEVSYFRSGEKERLSRVSLYNPSFQQVMRRFLKSDAEVVREAQDKMRGNPKDYSTVNYFCSQDGFTLADLVSYNERHNEANGENNKDGSSYNYSWNCGVEGECRKKQIRDLRDRQRRNAVLLLLLSQGIPMLYGGDEFGNTQGGNNNAWCQDNETGWVDYRAKRRERSFLSFVKKAILFRRENPILHMAGPLGGNDYRAMGIPDISFHGERAWYGSSDSECRMFGMMLNGCYASKEAAAVFDPEKCLYIACNFHWEERSFALPDLPEKGVWRIAVDSAHAPYFFAEEIQETSGADEQGTEKDIYRKEIRVSPRSVVVLQGRRA